MTVVVEVREYDPSKDLATVEEVERRCEVGPTGKLSLFTDLLGDPICRVRHSPSYLMLVITQTQNLTQNKTSSNNDEVIYELTNKRNQTFYLLTSCG